MAADVYSAPGHFRRPAAGPCRSAPACPAFPASRRENVHPDQTVPTQFVIPSRRSHRPAQLLGGALIPNDPRADSRDALAFCFLGESPPPLPSAFPRPASDTQNSSTYPFRRQEERTVLPRPELRRFCLAASPP